MGSSKRESVRAFAMASLLLLAACSSGVGARSAGAAASPQSAAQTAVARIGQPAPDWTEPTAPSGKLEFASLRGHPVYLNFFATWCPPCNEEASSIEALSRRYAARGLDVVGVDVLENASKAALFRSEHRLSFPTVVDDGTLRDRYRINGLPVHVFIDRSGIVRSIVVGQMSPAEIEAGILPLLH